MEGGCRRQGVRGELLVEPELWVGVVEGVQGLSQYGLHPEAQGGGDAVHHREPAHLLAYVDDHLFTPITYKCKFYHSSPSGMV